MQSRYVKSLYGGFTHKKKNLSDNATDLFKNKFTRSERVSRNYLSKLHSFGPAVRDGCVFSV